MQRLLWSLLQDEGDSSFDRLLRRINLADELPGLLVLFPTLHRLELHDRLDQEPVFAAVVLRWPADINRDVVRGQRALDVRRLRGYAVCEELGVSDTFGLAGNARLQRLAEPLLAEAQAEYARTGQKQRLFATWSYQADSWDRERTVIAKAECHSQGTNLRFVVTSERVSSPEAAEACYDAYIERGESEQRMDELKNGLSAGRLSCHRLLANVFRLLLHSFAYNLLAAVRDSEATPAELQRAQPAKWRSRLIKVAAVVVQSTRRVTIELSGCWPHWDLLAAVTQRVLAVPPVPAAALPP